MGPLDRRRHGAPAAGSPGTPPRGGLTYRDTGVDVERKSRLLEALAPAITRTLTADASPWGGFAGALALPPGAGRIAFTIDGVGTKTILARLLGRDRVIGSDIVAHCANDLTAAGAAPLCFLDYVALPRLDPPLLADLVAGMTEACTHLGIPLIGGETAEMPEVYLPGGYDVVGAMAGVVRFDVGAHRVRAGDVVIGLPSGGLHTNGFALARRAVEGLDLTAPDPDLGAAPGDALLAPHRCYAPDVHALMAALPIHAVAHITGGGLPGNLIRVLPEGCSLTLAADWPAPPIFPWLQRRGGIAEDEMRRTFNLGVGMTVIVSAADARAALQFLRRRGQDGWVIGAIAAGEREVIIR